MVPDPTSPHSGAFPTSSGLWGKDQVPRDLSQADLHQIGLLLRGESVVDWHRMHIETPAEAKRLFALNAIDIDNPDDRTRLAVLRSEAVGYIRETLRLPLDDKIATDVEIEQLPLIAAGSEKYQRSACLLLKVMHILYHLDARELRTNLPITDNDLFGLVEGSVVRMFDELGAAGLPVVEFAWSRKTRQSLITKLLVKKATSAARVFDRLRFRIVVESRDDVVTTLAVLLHRCIPFNYIVPGQTVNTLIERSLLERHAAAFKQDATVDPRKSENEFSSNSFKVLNFIADLPVRVDDLVPESQLPTGRGRVVFVLAEFQVLDRATAVENEQGDSAHANYKNRQHSRVKERLMRTTR